LRTEADEAKKLRAEIESLPALRNEVTQLMRQTNALADLQAEHERMVAQSKNLPPTSAPVALPPDFVTRAMLADVGQATPETALKTYFWAMTKGNVERIKQCYARGPGMDSQSLRMQSERMTSFNGYRIVERQDNVIPGAVILKLQSSPIGPILPLQFRKWENEWKLDN
jgi:hypothetical protein